MKEIERELEDQYLTKQDEKIAKLIEHVDKISELYQNTRKEIKQHVQEKVRLREEIAKLKLQLNPTIVQVKVFAKDNDEYQEKIKFMQETFKPFLRDDLFFIATKSDTEITEIDKEYFEQLPNEILHPFKSMIQEILNERHKKYCEMVDKLKEEGLNKLKEEKSK